MHHWWRIAALKSAKSLKTVLQKCTKNALFIHPWAMSTVFWRIRVNMEEELLYINFRYFLSDYYNVKQNFDFQ